MDRDKSLLDPGQSEEAVCNIATSRGILALIQYKGLSVRPCIAMPPVMYTLVSSYLPLNTVYESEEWSSQ